MERGYNMLIVIPKEKEESFDIVSDIHSRLLSRFRAEVNTQQPLHLKTINGFLGRIYHFDKHKVKVVVNVLAENDLVEIKKGSGIANYFVIIKKGDGKK